MQGAYPSKAYFCAVKILEAILVFVIRVYQHVISPLFGGNCRYTPTCSQYGVEAIREWGPFKGTWLALKRISKCHPWGGHGYDPVPRKDGGSQTEQQRSSTSDFTNHPNTNHQTQTGVSAA